MKIAVVEHTLKEQQVYRLVFDDNRSPLVITSAKTWNGEVWTSIPQGRQSEAELFGKEISKRECNTNCVIGLKLKNLFRV